MGKPKTCLLNFPTVFICTCKTNFKHIITLRKKRMDIELNYLTRQDTSRLHGKLV